MVSTCEILSKARVQNFVPVYAPGTRATSARPILYRYNYVCTWYVTEWCAIIMIVINDDDDDGDGDGDDGDGDDDDDGGGGSGGGDEGDDDDDDHHAADDEDDHDDHDDDDDDDNHNDHDDHEDDRKDDYDDHDDHDVKVPLADSFFWQCNVMRNRGSQIAKLRLPTANLRT